MAWFKVDDGFYTSQKVMRIPRSIRNEAIGAWVLIGTWSADKMADGVIPHWVIDNFDVRNEVVEVLIDSGLWVDNGEGVTYHDWCEYQPTREQLEEKRAAIHAVRSEAGIKSGESRRAKSNKNEQNGNKNEQNVNPEPEPEPEPVSSKELTINTFDEFWAVWPKRRGVGEARKAWAKAIRKEDKQVILEAATLYAQSPFLPEMQFIPLAATWLNQERWGDDLPQPTTTVQKPTAAQRNLSTVEYFRNQEALAVEA